MGFFRFPDRTSLRQPGSAIMLDRSRLSHAYETVRRELLACRTPAGHWVGELASSALSTATAISALSLVARHASWGADPPERSAVQQLVQRGLDWLQARQRPDGGWGDTDRSYSNIATTMLVRAACHLAGVADERAAQLAAAARYLEQHGEIVGLRRRYGRDKTFAVPILTNCALANLVPWREVSPLPFELACLPQQWYRFAHLPVVSYAIPALVAMGQARFHLAPPAFLPLRWMRKAAVAPSLRVLQRMQPASGGYLEATPLTSFVVMSLAATGRADHAVVQQGVRFLIDSVRADGSWPIDTNLATWNTTLACNALAAAGEDVTELASLDWLLNCQHRAAHPFTGAAPGGWGWTDLTGAVPDADDTPGALLTLAAWFSSPRALPHDIARIKSAAAAGLRWLLGLQNRDGGWPTFCRGWGKLPFDRSGADLTAHALRAIHAWREPIRHGEFAAHRITPRGVDRAVERGFRYLRHQQCSDGSFLPLWFGNQDHPREENPVYGTAKVLLAYRDCGQQSRTSAVRARQWLVRSQNPDGGWGGGASNAETARSTWEETALAVEALTPPSPGTESARNRGLEWLVERIESGEPRTAAPIGLYFAKLWYYETLYPIIFTVGALGSALRLGRLPGQAALPPPLLVAETSISRCGAIDKGGRTGPNSATSSESNTFGNRTPEPDDE